MAVVAGSRSVGLLLPVRLLLFAGFQILLAVAAGSWSRGAGLWPIAATLTNLVTIGLLFDLFRLEGGSYAALFRPDRSTLRADLLLLAGVIVIGAPLAILPNIWLAGWLFGDPNTALDLLLQPQPLPIVLAALAFPLTIMFAELPFYFGYIMPRLERQTRSTWLAVLLPALFLAAQHIALPLLFDLRFIAWRGLMYLPFALYLGVVLRWRPRLMPYLAIIHGLLDLSVVAMMFGRLA